MIEGNGPKWLFDIDSLTQSMNYVPVATRTISNESAGTQGKFNAGTSIQKEEINNDCIVMPIWKDASYFDSPSKDVDNGEPKSAADDQKQIEDGPDNENDEKDRHEDDISPKEVNTVGQHVNTASPKVNTGRFKHNTVGPSVNTASSYDQESSKDMFTMGTSHTLEATPVEFYSDEDKPEVDLGNITNSYTVPTTPNTRIHKDHPIENVIGDIEPTSIAKALSDSSWVEAMQEELLQFKLQQVWILLDLPIGKRAIGTKWVFRNKKDERGIVIRNKQGWLHRVIDKKKSAFLYRTIEEEVYVTQPPGFKDPDNPDKVYKRKDRSDIVHQEAKRRNFACTGELTFFLGLQVQQREDGIFISQDKYVDEILKKFNYTDVKSASTPVDLEKPLVKDGDANDVDVHLYRSMIGSFMYLTASRPDIMFAVCACARFQVTLKTSHLLAVKRIFRYLKGKPTLGLWYSRDSSFELVAYTDSDYAGATQDRKSTTKGCQFLGNRLISWQCKKQTVVATSTTKVEYVAAASCCGQIFLQKVLMLEVKNEWKDMLHQTKSVKHIGKSKEVETPRYLSLVVPLKKVGDEAVHKELGDRIKRAATTASSLEAEQDNATASMTANREVELTASIDVQEKTITEASLKRHLKLEDNDGITTLPNTEIFEQLALMGYQYEEGFNLELQKQLDEIEEVASKSRQAHDIDWSDPAVIRYHTLQNRSFSVAEVRKNMCYEEISSRKAEGRLKRKALKPREDKDKRQKKQDDLEKLMEYVEVISDYKEVISVTPLAVKSPIVGWKLYCKEDVGYYEIHMVDGSYKTYIFFSQMLNDFDREDLIVLYRLFNEKYASTRPGFDDLMLWGDMKVMFEPNSDDAVWKNHNCQELIDGAL
ncbi:hypothetical protein Tco_1568291 [Tanacetum coccineum]